jgi:hypothetical protein
LNCVAKTCNLLGWQVVCVHAKWLKPTCNLVTQRLAIRLHRRFGKFSTTWCVGTEILHGSIAGRISCESTILETLGSQTHTDNADQWSTVVDKKPEFINH